MKVQAMIFSAGLGTRLKPLTKSLPKALAPILDTSLLDYNIKFLANQGISDFVINTHHFGDKIEKCLNKYKTSNLNIQISKEIELLNTAGGIAKASNLFKSDIETILFYNVDVISSINIADMLKILKIKKSDILLATRDRISSRYLLFDEDENLKGWLNKKSNESIISEGFSQASLFEKAFSGIQLMNYDVLSEFEQDRVYSLIDFYLEKMNKLQISSYSHDQDYWFDCGSIDKLKSAEDYLKSR